MAVLNPQIGDLYIIAETGKFVNIETSELLVAGEEMSDEKQGEWPDDGKKYTYRDDPLIIIVEGYILKDDIYGQIKFTNTNREISEVVWSTPNGKWYKTIIENLEPN